MFAKNIIIYFHKKYLADLNNREEFTILHKKHFFYCLFVCGYTLLICIDIRTLHEIGDFKNHNSILQNSA